VDMPAMPGYLPRLFGLADEFHRPRNFHVHLRELEQAASRIRQRGIHAERIEMLGNCRNERPDEVVVRAQLRHGRGRTLFAPRVLGGMCPFACEMRKTLEASRQQCIWRYRI